MTGVCLNKIYTLFKCAVRSDTDEACSIHCIAFVLVLLSLYRLARGRQDPLRDGCVAAQIGENKKQRVLPSTYYQISSG